MGIIRKEDLLPCTFRKECSGEIGIPVLIRNMEEFTKKWLAKQKENGKMIEKIFTQGSTETDAGFKKRVLTYRAEMMEKGFTVSDEKSWHNNDWIVKAEIGYNSEPMKQEWLIDRQG